MSAALLSKARPSTMFGYLTAKVSDKPGRAARSRLRGWIDSMAATVTRRRMFGRPRYRHARPRGHAGSLAGLPQRIVRSEPGEEMVMAGDDYDVIVIGTSQGGRFLPADLAKTGRTVALIERDQLGGVCVNRGCTPTKTMVASASLAYH